MNIAIIGCGFAGISCALTMKAKGLVADVYFSELSSLLMFQGIFRWGENLTINRELSEMIRDSSNVAEKILMNIFEKQNLSLKKSDAYIYGSGIVRNVLALPSLNISDKNVNLITSPEEIFGKHISAFDFDSEENFHLLNRIPDNSLIPQILGVERYSEVFSLVKERGIREIAGVFPPTAGHRMKNIFLKTLTLNNIKHYNSKVVFDGKNFFCVDMGNMNYDIYIISSGRLFPLLSDFSFLRNNVFETDKYSRPIIGGVVKENIFLSGSLVCGFGSLGAIASGYATALCVKELI